MSDAPFDPYERERIEATEHEEQRANRRLSARWRRVVDAWRDLVEGDDDPTD